LEVSGLVGWIVGENKDCLGTHHDQVSLSATGFSVCVFIGSPEDISDAIYL